MAAERPSRRRAWTIGRRAVQGLLLLAFLALFVAARRGGWPAWLVNLPLRLDPLLALSHLLASRTLLAGSALALSVVALTLVFGRVWCAWVCPMGTVLDLFGPRRARPVDAAARWRSVKYVLLAFILVAAMLSSLTLLVLDPLTILVRSLSTALWPALDRAVTGVEAAAYQVGFLRPAVSAVETALRPWLLPSEPLYYRAAVLYFSVLAGVVGLSWLAPRFWCRALCPLGALLGLLGKASLLRRRVDSHRCTECGVCARVCPVGAVQPERGFGSDPAECIACQRCVERCPQDAIAFRALGQAPVESSLPTRRQTLAAVGAAVAGVALLRTEVTARRDTPWLIRPPGAQENRLLSKCVRCGECSRACPTSAIQPAIAEAGLEGLWTPVLLMRQGYCDYACNACGQVCPVEAIPRLELEEKRRQVIGLAYIDQNRCIPWADGRECLVCQEMCPVPDKAVVLEERSMRAPDGSMVTLRVPRVVRERCIGCGICEFKCPLNGEAAIRVYVPNDAIAG